MVTLVFVFLLAYWISKNYLVSISSCLLYGLLPAAVYTLSRSEYSHTLATMLLVVGVFLFSYFYFLGYCFLISRSNLARVFIPWMPLIMVYISYWIYQALSAAKDKKLSVGKVSICFLLLIAVLASNNRPQFKGSWSGRLSIYREAHDALNGRYSKKERVLAAPLMLYEMRVPLTHRMYFGKDIDYLLRLKGKGGLEKAIKIAQIKYLAIFKTKLDKRLKKGRRLKRQFRRFYSGIMKKYSMKKELVYLEEYAKKNAKQKLYESKRMTIYELK